MRSRWKRSSQTRSCPTRPRQTKSRQTGHEIQEAFTNTVKKRMMADVDYRFSFPIGLLHRQRCAPSVSRGTKKTGRRLANPHEHGRNGKLSQWHGGSRHGGITWGFKVLRAQCSRLHAQRGVGSHSQNYLSHGKLRGGTHPEHDFE